MWVVESSILVFECFGGLFFVVVVRVFESEGKVSW